MIADFGQRMENGRKVPSSINGEQIFNIFKDKPFGSILGRRAFEQSNDFKKERASFSGQALFAGQIQKYPDTELRLPIG